MVQLQDTHLGNGEVTHHADHIRLTLPTAEKGCYSNAQVNSPRGAQVVYTPPVRLDVKAYAEGQLKGTAGFGFWNEPFVPSQPGFRLPKAVWFFHASPPNNMALAKGVQGWGWKAATFNAARWQFLALLPTAPIGFLLMRIPTLYERLWAIGQAAIGVSEHLLPPETIYSQHMYRIDWLRDQVMFYLDGKLLHQTRFSPGGKLSFIAWVDNQYAVVTPQGRFGWGLLESPTPQALILSDLTITPT
jgi:hypothetical protein